MIVILVNISKLTTLGHDHQNCVRILPPPLLTVRGASYLSPES